jgi:hypothetical protein
MITQFIWSISIPFLMNAKPFQKWNLQNNSKLFVK